MIDLALVFAAAALASSTQPIDGRVLREANCHLRLTNDHVSGTIMYSDVARSSGECRSKAARFASDNNLTSMRDEVRTLYYEVEYRGRIIAKVNLK